VRVVVSAGRRGGYGEGSESPGGAQACAMRGVGAWRMGAGVCACVCAVVQRCACGIETAHTAGERRLLPMWVAGVVEGGQAEAAVRQGCRRLVEGYGKY